MPGTCQTVLANESMEAGIGSSLSMHSWEQARSADGPGLLLTRAEQHSILCTFLIFRCSKQTAWCNWLFMRCWTTTPVVVASNLSWYQFCQKHWTETEKYLTQCALSLYCFVVFVFQVYTALRCNPEKRVHRRTWPEPEFTHWAL